MPVNGLKAGIQPKDIWWKSVGQTRNESRLTDTLISRIDAAGREFSWQNDRRRAPSCERIISYLDNLPNVFSLSMASHLFYPAPQAVQRFKTASGRFIPLFSSFGVPFYRFA